jgi:hypothetical protein
MRKTIHKFLFVAILIAPISAMANDDISRELNRLLPAAGAPTTMVIDQSYVPSNLENLMKVYTNLGVLDTAKPEHLDQYLAVTECSLYKQFRTNEFEWAKIRIATQDSLKKHKDSFSRRFEFVQPVMLKEYDFTRGGFLLDEKFIIPNVSKIQITNNTFSYNNCVSLKDYDSSIMPINAALSIDRPFSLMLIPSNQQVAQQYVDYLTENQIDTREGRPAYLKFRVKLDRLLEKTGEKDSSLAIFYGQIESITVYGDRDQMIKLYEQNY